MDLLPGEPWLQEKLPVAQWPADTPRWARTAAHGDRRTELGLVGMDADPAAVRRVLARASSARTPRLRLSLAARPPR